MTLSKMLPRFNDISPKTLKKEMSLLLREQLCAYRQLLASPRYTWKNLLAPIEDWRNS